MHDYQEPLSEAQEELYEWLVEYIRTHRHAPSVRQMMRAMNLKSPAPIQSRLDHLKRKGYVTWEYGSARTLRILDGKTLLSVSPTVARVLIGHQQTGEPLEATLERLIGRLVAGAPEPAQPQREPELVGVAG